MNRYRTKAPFVSAIVLAAGSSERMPARNKLMLDCDGKPILLRAIENLQKAGLDELIVVVQAAGVWPFLATMDVRLVENHEFREGIASSIRCGVQNLSGHSDAVLIALGDMPFVKPATIRGMREHIENRAAPIIIYPFHKNRQGNPVLFSHHFFSDLQRLRRDRGAKSIIRQNHDAAQPFACDDPGVLIDIDTPEDCRRYSDSGEFFSTKKKPK